jgi:signal transduction histidine kinase
VSEAQLVLIFMLATLLVVMLAWLTLFSVVSAKTRIIAGHRRSLAAEQQLRLAQAAFTDNAHHELRTPLQVLLGHLQMLELAEATPQDRAILQQAQQATAKLTHMVQSLLDYSSLAQGTLSLQAELEDLDAHLHSLADCFQLRASARGLSPAVDLDSLPRPLLCNAHRLSQALDALLDNAIGFSVHGQVSFRLKAHEESGIWNLRFEIQDDGPGLPPDWQHLLEPYEQGEHGLRRRCGGFGLGLPLARGIIEGMGGRLGLVSLPKGTLAWVEITLREAAQ